MNPLAREWVEKAEGDRETARRELAAATNPNHDAVCFHAQQCVEKLMKAVLAENGATFTKTHDLIYLDGLVTAVASSWKCDQDDLYVLVPAAVDYRYPGISAGALDAQAAFDACERLRAGLLALLPP